MCCIKMECKIKQKSIKPKCSELIPYAFLSMSQYMDTPFSVLFHIGTYVGVAFSLLGKLMVLVIQIFTVYIISRILSLSDSDDQRANIALAALPCILPTGRKGKKRSSIDEALNCFIDIQPVSIVFRLF